MKSLMTALAVLTLSAPALAGNAASDAVTAKLRDSFTAAAVLTQTQVARLAGDAGWDCTYHASTNDVVFRGFNDVDYHSTFAVAGILVKESAEDVRSGDLAFDPWQGDYAVTGDGLRSDGEGATRVIRSASDGSILVEWLFHARAGDPRGDVGVSDKTMRTTGYAVCTGVNG